MNQNGPVPLGASVESLVSRASTTTCAAAHRRPLRCLTAPRPRLLTHKARLLGAIPEALRGLLHELCAGRAPWPLFLWGPPGTGKSCAALVLCDYAVSAMYWDTASLCEDLVLAGKGQLHYDSGRPVHQKALWAEIREKDLVVLDEVGARSEVKDWHYECVKRLLDTREGSPLVVISNMDLEALAQLYDDRVASRLAAGTVFRLGGPDRRLRA